MPFFGKKFRYSLLQYKRSLLTETRAEPLAVLVESDGRAIVIGRVTPSNVEGVSVVGRDVLADLPNVLIGQVKKMQPRDFSRGLIPALASANSWNLAFSEPVAMKSDQPIEEVAFMLFARHIMKGARFAELATETGEPQSHTERLELFEVAAPVAAGV